MQYFSTGNAAERTPPPLALLNGLAPDGGLLPRPTEIPKGLSGIRELSVLHTDIIDPAGMGAYIQSVL